MIKLELDQTLIVDVKRLGINGEGIAYYQKLAIFVDNVLPNEVVEIKIIEVNSKYAKGELIKIIEKSSERVEPFCKHYYECGACQLQHLNYQNSLDYKREMIFLSLSRYSEMNPKTFEIKKVIGMENPLGYRNKSTLPVNFDGKKAYVGMYSKNSNRLVKIDSCPIQHDVLNHINAKVCDMIQDHTLTCFNPKSKKGHIRYLVSRVSFSEKTAQISFIVNEESSKLTELGKNLIGKENIVSAYKSFNNDVQSHEIFGKNIEKIAGEDSIYEKLGNLKFSLLPNAFFQLNPAQTIILYDEIKKACKSTKEHVIWDSFCGVGTISLWLHDKAKKVYGFDINKESIISAKKNLAINPTIKNVEFFVKDITKLESSFITSENKPDIIVADPPRTGLGNFIQTILKISPNMLIYVSCNPSTLAKDLAQLKNLYKVKYIQPIDMFPFTSSIETIAVLSIKTGQQE